MFHDLQSLSTWPFSQRSDGFPWVFFGFLFFSLLLGMRRRRRNGDTWRQRGEEMRERAERNAAELRVYHEQVLVELRQQNDLLRKLLGERGIDLTSAEPAVMGESMGETPDTDAEATEPATEI